MTAPPQQPPSPNHRSNPAPNGYRQRPSSEDIERRYAHALRVFAQTAVVSAVIGGICLIIHSHTTYQMALFILAWAAGWTCATFYLLVRRALKSVHRPRKH